MAAKIKTIPIPKGTLQYALAEAAAVRAAGDYIDGLELGGGRFPSVAPVAAPATDEPPVAGDAPQSE